MRKLWERQSLAAQAAGRGRGHQRRAARPARADPAPGTARRHFRGARRRRAPPALRTAARGTWAPSAAWITPRNGFDPQAILRDFDEGAVSGRRARVGDRRRGPRDRGRAGGQVRRLDLQRARARPDAACPRGRAPADPLRQRLRAPAHDALPRHPPRRDATASRASAPGNIESRRSRPSTSSTPRRSGSTSTTATPRRWPSTSPRASTAPSSSTPKDGRADGRRARDGHERLRHELRPLERGLRGQHRRLRVHGRAGPGQARRAGADLPGQRARVRPRSTRSTSTPTSSTTTRPAPASSRATSRTRSSRARASAGSSSCASRTPGKYMFHAHVSEFAELGWMGFFEVED